MTFEELRDRAIEHCQFLTDYVKENPEALKRSWIKVWAFFDIGLLTADEAMAWKDCMSRSAWEGGTK